MITNETITARFAADRHATIAWKNQLSADLDAIVTAYGAADKPADTIATVAAEIGIDRVRAIIATLTVYRVAMRDRRIGDDTAAWAQTIADALDADAAERVGLITDTIHPAHLDQLARAAAEYVEPETAPAAEPETVETKAYRMSYRDGRGGYPEIIVLAESAEQATAYYTAEYGVTVVSCDETSWPTPEQPRGIVPIGWTAADAETETETTPAAEPETEATETTETTERAEVPEIIARMVEIIISAPARSAWARGVRAYAAELCGNLRRAATYAAEAGTPSPLTDRETVRAALLNGARDWSEYSWSGCALIYDGHIAARVCTPSELRRTHGGQRDPNPRETWLDVQARALYQAGAVVLAAYGKVTREGVRA